MNRPKPQTRSIRRFLLGSITTLILVGWLISALFNFRYAREQVEELFDAELAQMTRILQSFTADEFSRDLSQRTYFDERVLAEVFDERESSIWGHEYERKLAFQIWSAEGQLLLATHLPLPTDFAAMQRGYHSLQVDDQTWFSFSLFDEARQLWFRVAQRADVRTELTQEIAWSAIFPGLLLAPMLLLLTTLSIGRGLSPLTRMSREIKDRDYQNLGELNAAAYPIELQAPVRELNQLFRRVSESYERERRFTADAAHELRTPLAIAKVHLQNVEQLAQTEELRTGARSALSGINRLIHLVQQLLTLSRIESGLETQHQGPTDLVAIIREESEALEWLPELKTCRFEFDLPEKKILHANEPALRIILRNLLDNACRYSTLSRRVEVELANDHLTLRNQCPALEAHEIAQLFERFKRGQDNKSQGSGLGLAICRELCERNGLRLTLHNRQDGLEGVEVVLDWSQTA